MKQKLDMLKRQEFAVLQKEVTLGSLLKQHLEAKNKDLSKFDDYAKIVMFSIDGAVPASSEGRIMSPAEMMDVVVRPDQKVLLLPRLAGG